MKASRFAALISSKKAFYLYDDYQEIVMMVTLDGGSWKFFVKHEGRKEVELPQSSETVCDALGAGKEITRKQYEEY